MGNVADTLRDVLGDCVGSDAILPPDALDWPDYLVPEAIVCPATEAELAAVMACAHGHRWRVVPCGSGSKLAWGGVGTGVDLVVSTARLNRVIDHAVGDMTLTVQAGAKLADLVPLLGQHRQFLAVDPAYGDRATLGGIVATADTGSLRQGYGGLRDRLIGLTFVRADGAVTKAGGRVVKNVAGYDLMKLLTGSYGTLGVISQLTVRLYPQQEASTTVAVSGTAPAIAALVADLRRSPLTPVALDALTATLAARLGYGAAPMVLVQFQAIAPAVDEQVQALLARVGKDLKAEVLTGEAEEPVWAAAQAALFPGDSDGILAKVGMPAAAAIPWLAALPDGALGRIHCGSGLGALRLGSATAADIARLRAALPQGYLTLLEAPTALKTAVDPWDYRGNALAVMTALKTQFDPQGILSPGRFVGGL